MHKCTPSGLFGAIQAKIAIDDGPIFDPKNINESSFDAQLSFAKALNKQEAKYAANIQKLSEDDSVLGATINRINQGRTPEALIPKTVYNRVDKKMTQWSAYYHRSFYPKIRRIEQKYARIEQGIRKSKAANKEQLLVTSQVRKDKELAPLLKEASKSYRDMIGGQFKQANQQIQDVYNQHAENPVQLDAALRKMGFKDRQQAYYTHQYLNWLENGGPFFTFNKGGGNKVGGDTTQELVSTVTGNKISFDPKQVLYNTTEFVQKAPAVAGFKNTITGVLDASKAAQKAKLTVFDRLPELERAGIYHNDYTPLRPEGQNDTTTRTQNMLDNFSYFVGKRMGDVNKALTGIAYRPKPWNDTFGFQDPRMKSAFSFMSFQFRHMQQYGGWWKSLAVGSKKEQGEAAKALLVYSLMTGVLFGDRAAMPAPVYWLAKAAMPNLDEDIKEIQKETPLIGEVLNAGITGLAAQVLSGGQIDFDFTKYVQPFGGVGIGIGTDIAQGTWDAATRTIPKAAKEIQDGRTDKALAIAINGLVQGSQIFKQGANAFIQKTVDGAVKAYLEDEFTPEGLAEHIGKKYVGREAVKVAK